jgi:hypothetical protein
VTGVRWAVEECFQAPSSDLIRVWTAEARRLLAGLALVKAVVPPWLATPGVGWQERLLPGRQVVRYSSRRTVPAREPFWRYRPTLAAACRAAKVCDPATIDELCGEPMTLGRSKNG